MATIHVKTVQYTCPHCHRKLKSTPYNDYCALGGKLYGDPYDTCPKCKRTYRNAFSIEPATELTLSQRVPFFLTGVRTLVAEIIFAVILVMLAFSGVPELLLGLVPVAAVHVAVSAFTRSYRQKHKDQLLNESRQRLKDPEKFLQTAMPFMGTNMKTQLTPQQLLLMHRKALADMDADRPVQMRRIICEAFGLPVPAQESPRQKKLKKLTTAIQIPGAILSSLGLLWLLTRCYYLEEEVSWPVLVLTGVGLVLLIVTPKVTEWIAQKGTE